jgi:hypothetical protein
LATIAPGAAFSRPRGELLWAPIVAAALASLAVLIGLRGVDLPAQLYRVDLFHRSGLTLWDSQWYGGHWTLNYSVIFPPLAGLIGVGLTEVASAAVAALTFDRLVVAGFGRSAKIGSLLFALGTLAQVAIGQLPFLLGEALALTACLMAVRRRWSAATAFAFATPLASPLAGAFLALAILAWIAADWPRPRPGPALMIAAAGLPAVALSVLFPGQGVMPFPTTDFIWLLLLFGAAGALLPRRDRGVRIGVALYLAAIAVSFGVATPVGGNISRLGECVGAPLLLAALWPRRRLLALAVAIPILTLQWGPALATFVSNGADPSTRATYFRPLISFLQRHQSPLGRVEIVPTKLHWEAAYVAPSVALARGWERQLDTADNPIFYQSNALTAASYDAWLLANGVRYVALPDVALDYAGKAEAAAIATGVHGLRLAWHDAHWRVFAVRGSSGIVSGPARLLAVNGSHLSLQATGTGTIVLRERYSPGWRLVGGQGCVRQDPGGWTAIDVAAPGQLQLALGLGGAAEPSCAGGAR